jgi:hypothetical protein
MSIRLLKMIALVALVVGAAASLIALWRAGQGTPPVVLAGMTLWVASPFALLALGFARSRLWPAPNVVLLYGLTAVLAVVCPIIYANNDALRPAGRPRAALFVALPPICWVMITAVLMLGVMSARRVVSEESRSR